MVHDHAIAGSSKSCGEGWFANEGYRILGAERSIRGSGDRKFAQDASGPCASKCKRRRCVDRASAWRKRCADIGNAHPYPTKKQSKIRRCGNLQWRRWGVGNGGREFEFIK